MIEPNKKNDNANPSPKPKLHPEAETRIFRRTNELRYRQEQYEEFQELDEASLKLTESFKKDWFIEGSEENLKKNLETIQDVLDDLMEKIRAVEAELRKIREEKAEEK
ncbi:hypothetical protein K458DRAFT_395955 [Lentithecium fluviatile CBS 122367]|uniref:Uncharacterized protein n=1 Tax=Lentithecium fluviatile CBS 122367 TaxID=1168545 RepID=A0A6G1IGV0_9PLEO|nr:hypothetical protein K458DRAFT_395955 [Lentithecium fluviatile CBS 122367]